MANNWSMMTGMRPVACKNFPKATPLKAACATLAYGLELEIENVPAWEDMLVPGIRGEPDGSLRNNGREFITQPMTFSNLAHCLYMFFGKNKLGPENYSERCSIHVHTNCLDLTEEQIQTIAFVYQLVEHCLFEWVDHERSNNIFCVPWSQTNLTYRVLEDREDMTRFKRWQKYTALNLLPLYTQGTIEWRHMNGHCDVNKILEWCQLIGHIYAFALTTPLEKVKEHLLTLNTSSQYRNVLEMIFQERAFLFYSLPNYERHLEEGVINMKYSIGNPSKTKPKTMLEFARFPADFQANIEAVRHRLRPAGPNEMPAFTPQAEVPIAGREWFSTQRVYFDDFVEPERESR